MDDNKIKTDFEVDGDGFNLDYVNKYTNKNNSVQNTVTKANNSNETTVQNVDVSSGGIVNIKVKLDDNIYSNRIALSAGDAKNNKFVNESHINRDIWNSADLSIVDRGDGTYAIKNGDTIVGFTDKYDVNSNSSQSTDTQSTSGDSSSSKFDTSKLDLSLISLSEGDVLNNKHVNTVNENIFRNGDITVQDVGNGVYAIKNNGITIGYTNEAGINYNSDVKPDESNTSSNSSTDESVSTSSEEVSSYEFSKDAILTGSISGEKFNQSRTSSTADGVLNGEYSTGLLDDYQGKELLYEVGNNGIVSIICGDKIVGYTDVFGCSEIRSQLREGTSPFIDFLISIDERLALESGGSNSLGDIINEYNKDKKVDYSEISYQKGTNCGSYGSSNGMGIISIVTVGDRTYNSYCQGTGAWGSAYAGSGCAKTALSTIFSGFEEGFTPSDYMKTGGTLKDHINAKGYKYNDLQTKDDIIDELKQGHPVMYHILNGHVPNADSGTKNYGEHWVALLGYDEETGKVYMSEPGSTHSDGFYDLSLFSNFTDAFSVYKEDNGISTITSGVSETSTQISTSSESSIDDSSVDTSISSSLTDNTSLSIFNKGESVVGSGVLSINDISLSRISTTEEGVYNGNFSDDAFTSYSDKNNIKYSYSDEGLLVLDYNSFKDLNYKVMDNGVVSISIGEDVIGYTDIFGVSSIKNSLSSDGSDFISYIAGVNDNFILQNSKTLGNFAFDYMVKDIESVDVHANIFNSSKRLERLQDLFPQITNKDSFYVSQGDVSSQIETIEVPIWNGSEMTTMKLSVHSKLKNNYLAAFTELASLKYTIKSDTTGAYNYRKNTGGTRLSDHALGGAIDINWDVNPYISGDNPNLGKSDRAVTEEVIEVMAKYGFYWGGDWTGKKDYMHFSYTGG